MRIDWKTREKAFDSSQNPDGTVSLESFRKLANPDPKPELPDGHSARLINLLLEKSIRDLYQAIVSYDLPQQPIAYEDINDPNRLILSSTTFLPNQSYSTLS